MNDENFQQGEIRLEGMYTHLVDSSTSQECPATLLEELVRVVIDGLHDGTPVQVDRTLGDRDVNRAKIGY